MEMRGGASIAQGVDTCVFSPAIRCDGDPARASENYVSRIVAHGSQDAAVEAVLRSMPTVQPLLQNKLIAVSVASCVPAVELPTDAYVVQPGKGCDRFHQRRLAGYPSDNLITPKFNGNTIGEAFHSPEGAQWTIQRKLMEVWTALWTTVCLVPNEYPWVIHMDLHFGNILRNVDATNSSVVCVPLDNQRIGHIAFTLNSVVAGISDWGRVIHIRNAAELQAKFNAWRIENGNSIYQEWLQTKALRGAWIYTQHPPELFRYLGFEPSAYELQRTLRGIMPYTILRQIGMTHEQCRPLLLCANTTELTAQLSQIAVGQGLTPQFVCAVAPQRLPGYVQVVNANGGSAITAKTASKFGANCNVKDPKGNYVLAYIPRGKFATAAEREPLYTKLSVGASLGAIAGALATAVKTQYIFTWLLSHDSTYKVQLHFTQCVSALEVASGHDALIQKVNPSGVLAAGEVTVDTTGDHPTFQFNFESDIVTSSMFAPEAACRNYVEQVKNIVRQLLLTAEFKHVAFEALPPPGPHATRASAMGILGDEYIAAYRELGIQVVAGPDVAACRAKLSRLEGDGRILRGGRRTFRRKRGRRRTTRNAASRRLLSSPTH